MVEILQINKMNKMTCISRRKISFWVVQESTRQPLDRRLLLEKKNYRKGEKMKVHKIKDLRRCKGMEIYGKLITSQSLITRSFRLSFGCGGGGSH